MGEIQSEEGEVREIQSALRRSRWCWAFCCCTTCPQNLQFSAGNIELCLSAIEAYCQVRKNPDDRLVKTVESGEVNGNFAIEQPITHRSTALTTHDSLTGSFASVQSCLLNAALTRITTSSFLSPGVGSAAKFRPQQLQLART
jgi:hypothetical protein